MPDWPAASVTMRPLDAVLPYQRNPRAHSDEQIEQIARSIRRFGFTMPVLVDEDSIIIAGHARVLAAHKLSLPQIPVMTARGWTDAEKRAYVIADNQLTLNSSWDEGLLRLELGDLRLEGFDLSLTGFGTEALGALLADRSQGLTDPDEIPPMPEQPVARPGDTWLLGRHRLYCGDCTDPLAVATVLAGKQPHLMVTDPPYGVEYAAEWRDAALGGQAGGRATGAVANDGRSDWRAAWQLYTGDVAYVWHADRYSSAVIESLEASGFVLRSQIIWAKSHLVVGRGDYHYQHEACWYVVRKGKRGHWAAARDQTTLWQVDKPHKSETGHSTQKPVACMRRPMENNSRAGQTVYDPFLGSGTTVIAAEMAGRTCLALEVNPAYCDVAIKRWQNFTGLEAVRERDGLTMRRAPQTKKRGSRSPPAT